MIDIVQGAQWGSEAKGTIMAWMSRNCDIAVRTGAINAGHTFYADIDGVRHKIVMQQIPCAWHRSTVALVLGPGTYIHPDTLDREIELIRHLTGEDLRESGRLDIDENCGIHHDSFADESKSCGRSAKIGATGKGCAEAVIHKIRERNSGHPLSTLFVDDVRSKPYSGCFVDVPHYLAFSDDDGANILLEGTQGELLDLHTGPYPFTTNRQTIPASWIAEAGLSPTRNIDVHLVARTYPIRVAGNSGPMPGEIDWSDLAVRSNDRLISVGREPMISLSALASWEKCCCVIQDSMGLPYSKVAHYGAEERQRYGKELLEFVERCWASLAESDRNELSKLFEITTVTKRLRRIAEMDCGLLSSIVCVERPKDIIVTFFNYVFPELWGSVNADDFGPEHFDWIGRLENEMNVDVLAVTTGPYEENIIEL